MRISTGFCLVCAAFATLLAGCSATAPAPVPPPTTQGSFTNLKGNDAETVRRRKLLFYAIGIDIGQRIAASAQKDDVAIEERSLRDGLGDGLNARKPAYDAEELADAVAAVEARVAMNVAARRYAADPEFKAMADRNLLKSQEAMEEFAMRAGVVKQPNGVLTKQMKPGTGRYVATASTLTGRFSVYLVSGALVRESEPGKPVTVKTAKMLPAVRDAIQEMRAGATWRVAVPSELAYGMAGAPPAIGPNQAVILEIELIDAE